MDKLNEGTRVRVTGVMKNDPDPIPVGAQGTVIDHNVNTSQINVVWDNGRTLILLEEDPFAVI